MGRLGRRRLEGANENYNNDKNVGYIFLLLVLFAVCYLEPAVDDDLENCVWVLCLDHELLLYRNGGLKLFHHIRRTSTRNFLIAHRLSTRMLVDAKIEHKIQFHEDHFTL